MFELSHLLAHAWRRITGQGGQGERGRRKEGEA